MKTHVLIIYKRNTRYHMPLYEIISLIGFILGTTLHIVLSILIVQRKHKTRSELVFLFLVISVAMWHFGNTVSLFSFILFGRKIQSVDFVADAISYGGNWFYAQSAAPHGSSVSF